MNFFDTAEKYAGPKVQNTKVSTKIKLSTQTKSSIQNAVHKTGNTILNWVSCVNRYLSRVLVTWSVLGAIVHYSEMKL